MVHKDLYDEIDQAYANVDLALRNAGGKGWSQVYKARAYVTDMSPEMMDGMVKCMKKWAPNHQPTLTAVGVTQLGVEGMRIEVEAMAYDEEGTRLAGAAASNTKE
jgi:enamine deaminase RidA (YjgF/YER057c/UK114 family)